MSLNESIVARFSVRLFLGGGSFSCPDSGFLPKTASHFCAFSLVTQTCISAPSLNTSFNFCVTARHLSLADHRFRFSASTMPWNYCNNPLDFFSRPHPSSWTHRSNGQRRRVCSHGRSSGHRGSHSCTTLHELSSCSATLTRSCASSHCHNRRSGNLSTNGKP